MKRKLSRVCSVFILLTIVISSVVRVSDYLQLKESDNRYASFFTEKQPIDVLLLGSSHVRHGFFPMELWKEYGITSYNLAGNGSTLPVSYWTLVNALDYQIPKVVVMDVFDMWPGRKFSVAWGQVHEQFDAFPVSIHKFQMINDLFDDESLTDGGGNSIYDKRWEIFWDLGEYHTRWTELTKEDFDSKKTIAENSRVWKGASPLIAVVDREKHIYGSTTDNMEYDEIARDYLERMISLCEEKNIELMLINTSYDCNDESKLFHDSVAEIAKRNNLVYLDFTKENIIDFSTDLFTTGHNTHVNFSGAQRFTKYLGVELDKHYNLDDHRNDECFNRWWIDYEKYVNSKQEYLRNQEEIINYLVLLNDYDYQVLIEVIDDSILDELKIANMITNLGVQLNENDKLLYIDVGTENTDMEFNKYESEYSWKTVAGQLNCSLNEEGLYEIYLDSENVSVADSEETDNRIKFIVFSKKKGCIIDKRVF